MNTATKDFGQHLRSARERLGVPLEAIVESTKIKRSLLVELERGDVSKWPRGIYRRAFVREYASMIGLPADRVVAEFLELFPEEDGASAAARPIRVSSRTELRLTMVADRRQAVIDTLWRLAVAMLELSAIVGLGWLLTPFTGAGLWTVCGVIALTYYPIAAACSTRAPAFRLPALKPLVTASRDGMPLIQLVLQRPPVQSADERTA